MTTTWEHVPHTLAGTVPFTITAKLVEPIVYARDGLHLDGLLTSAALRDLDDRTRARMTPVSTEEWVPDVELPLARWCVRVPVPVTPHVVRLCRERQSQIDRKGYGELWGWCASAEDARWVLHGRAEIRKKPALDEMARYSDSPSVTISAGSLKAYDLTLPTVQAHQVSWHALGDPDKTVTLLRRHVDALGRKRGLGWGVVSSWHVERAEEDWSIERWDADTETQVLMRRMPREARFQGRQSIAAIRPPYFHPSRMVPATEPAL